MHALEKDNHLLKPLYTLRADNLTQVADEWGQDLKLAKALGISGTRLHQLIRKRNVPFTEKLARAMEARLGKPYGWLDEADANDPTAPKKFHLPIYFLEDLNHLASARPAGTYRYITDFPDAYFVQVTAASYAPKLQPGTLILVNPQKKLLEEKGIYILAYTISDHLLRPVLRKFSERNLCDLLTGEADAIQEMVIYGKCELFINTQPG